MLKHILFIFILTFSCYYFWTTRPVTHGPGVVAPSEPTQKNTFGVHSIEYKSYDIRPLAEFNVEARVLSKRRYSDKYSEISPYDLVLGWGPMSDERILDKILINQSERYYQLEMATPPIPRWEMLKYSTNIHLASSSQEILDQIRKVRKGHIIKITGYLVRIDSNEGWIIKSSLRRDDFGEDASEVVWIKDFQIL